jgi:cytochrome c-type biogenesis protein CcmH
VRALAPRTRRLALTVALVVTATVTLACGSATLVAAGKTTPPPTAHPRATLPDIEPQVMCVTCKIPLNVAESTQADDERAFIQELINKGEDEAEIKRSLVSQYGPLVLGLPKASGFNLAAYLVPVLVVALLVGIMLVLLPRWRRESRRSEHDGGAAVELSPGDAARLDSDLARFD